MRAGDGEAAGGCPGSGSLPASQGGPEGRHELAAIAALHRGVGAKGISGRGRRGIGEARLHRIEGHRLQPEIAAQGNDRAGGLARFLHQRPGAGWSEEHQHPPQVAWAGAGLRGGHQALGPQAVAIGEGGHERMGAHHNPTAKGNQLRGQLPIQSQQGNPQRTGVGGVTVPATGIGSNQAVADGLHLNERPPGI